MASWDLAGMCMRAQFDQQETQNIVQTNLRGNNSPFSFLPDSTANIDWDAPGMDMGAGSVDGSGENKVSGSGLGAGDDNFGMDMGPSG